MVGTALTDVGAGVKGLFGEIEPERHLPLWSLFSEQGRADGAHEGAALVDEYLCAELLSERLYYTLIPAHAALENHRGRDFFALAYIREVVGRHRAAETGHEVSFAVAYLGFVDQIRLGEHGAAGRDGGGGFGFEREGAHVFDVQPQASGLGREESAGSGGAEGIHGVVGHNAIV